MKRKMKVTICIVLPVIILSVLYICLTKITIFSNNNATLKFIYADSNIVQTLTDEETEKVKEMFSGCSASVFDLPTCGFDDNVTISFGGQIFAVACDGCNTVKECKPVKYFSISLENREYITALFEKYGGYFPCN